MRRTFRRLGMVLVAALTVAGCGEKTPDEIWADYADDYEWLAEQDPSAASMLCELEGAAEWMAWKELTTRTIKEDTLRQAYIAAYCPEQIDFYRSVYQEPFKPPILRYTCDAYERTGRKGVLAECGD